MAQRLSTEAYGALRGALSVVTWDKKPFASMMRGLLRDSPALRGGEHDRLPNLEAHPVALDEEGAAQRAADAVKAERNRVFSAELRGLRDRYLAIENAIDPHQRGLDFAKLLNSLFVLSTWNRVPVSRWNVSRSGR